MDKSRLKLHKLGWQVSRHHIGRFKKGQGLVYKYTVAKFKTVQSTVNDSEVKNELDWEFN